MLPRGGGIPCYDNKDVQTTVALMFNLALAGEFPVVIYIPYSGYFSGGKIFGKIEI